MNDNHHHIVIASIDSFEILTAITLISGSFFDMQAGCAVELCF